MLAAAAAGGRKPNDVGFHPFQPLVQRFVRGGETPVLASSRLGSSATFRMSF